MDLGLSGLVSGLDWKTLVDQLAEAERAPQNRLRSDQSVLQKQNSAYASINTQLGKLQEKVTTLKDSLLFDSRLAGTSNEANATATTADGTALGAYVFNFTQLATAARQAGASGVGVSLSATNDVSGLVLSDAAFSAAVTAGTFTVNGKQITIAATDTLQSVFDQIATATGGTVTASYDSGTDRISLSSSSPIVLGSATDTSNFLQIAKLYNNGTGTISSTSELGVIKQNAALNAANLATTIDDGGLGLGEFKINGVSIAFAATDTVSAVLKRINDSGAGVSASYDTVNDRFLLSNKTTGDIGIALEDVTGNFLAATGLSGGALERGKNLLYTVNGGSTLVSQSNTITEASSSIAGLSVTAITENTTTTITVSSDTAKIKTAINDFLAEYNKTQSLIDSQTASTTDAKGKVTAGILASENDAGEIATKLRRVVTENVAGLADALNQLEELGIVSNGNDNSLSLSNESKLDAALANNLNTVRNLFADTTSGLAVKLDAYLTRTAGDAGSLQSKQDRITKQATDIDTQIADLERVVESNRQRMIESFIAMETAQSQVKQQQQFLQQRFGTASSTAA